MSESFQRQRRNVIVISMILLALCFGDVDIKGLTFAGMTFGAFKSPEIFLYGLWIAFVYFVYRYFLYFLRESLKDIKSTWMQELENAVNPRIERLVRQRYDRPHEAHLYSYQILRKNKFIYIGAAYFQRDAAQLQSAATLENIEMPITRRSILFWEFLGTMKTIFLTPAFTEHLLPFLLAAGTFSYCGFEISWAGNFNFLFS